MVMSVRPTDEILIMQAVGPAEERAIAGVPF